MSHRIVKWLEVPDGTTVDQMLDQLMKLDGKLKVLATSREKKFFGWDERIVTMIGLGEQTDTEWVKG